MINPGGFVVCLCGVFFLFEAAEMYHLPVDSYLGDPFFDMRFPIDSLVFGIAPAGEFPPVAVVLRLRSGAEVRLAIIDAVVVYMVGEQAVGDLDYFAVHEYEGVLSR